jgi:hypothetical protein
MPSAPELALVLRAVKAEKGRKEEEEEEEEEEGWAQCQCEQSLCGVSPAQEEARVWAAVLRQQVAAAPLPAQCIHRFPAAPALRPRKFHPSTTISLFKFKKLRR